MVLAFPSKNKEHPTIRPRGGLAGLIGGPIGLLEVGAFPGATFKRSRLSVYGSCSQSSPLSVQIIWQGERFLVTLCCSQRQPRARIRIRASSRTSPADKERSFRRVRRVRGEGSRSAARQDYPGPGALIDARSPIRGASTDVVGFTTPQPCRCKYSVTPLYGSRSSRRGGCCEDRNAPRCSQASAPRLGAG